MDDNVIQINDGIKHMLGLVNQLREQLVRGKGSNIVLLYSCPDGEIMSGMMMDGNGSRALMTIGAMEDLKLRILSGMHIFQLDKATTPEGPNENPPAS